MVLIIWFLLFSKKDNYQNTYLKNKNIFTLYLFYLIFNLLNYLKFSYDKKVKDLLVVLSITLIIFLSVDYFLGNKILNIFDINKDSSYRISDDIFNHGFKKNYKTNNAFWGPNKYIFCSNNHGTRNDCSNDSKKKYDYAFIGDSQTEGVGLNFEDTFVGNFAKQNKLDVINLGIIRSSPSLYLKRLKFFLEQEIRFKELFILIDMSDLYDELRYNKNIFKNDNMSVCKPNNTTKKINTLTKNSISNRIKSKGFQMKRIIKDNFKISYALSELIWWKMNFKEFFSSYTFDYLDKNYYRTAWVYNNNLGKFGSTKCLEHLIKSTQNIVNNIYDLLNYYNIKLSIIVANAWKYFTRY